MANWKAIRVPSNLYEAVKEIVNAENSLYNSVSDFTKEALRTRVTTINERKKTNKKTSGEKQ